MVSQLHKYHVFDRGETIEFLKAKVREQYGAHHSDISVVRAPFRVCPLGAHIDHQGGEVSGMAIDRSILLAFVPTEQPTVRLLSMDFPGSVEFSYHDIPARRPGDWGNYARGAARALLRTYPLTAGVDGIISGGLPTGGVSSSAALGVACLLALEAANNIAVTARENIELDQYIENTYLGLDNGILDQSMILLGRRGQLTHMDCHSGDYQHIRFPGQQSQFAIALVYSGVVGRLIDTDFNKHVAECREAAAILLREAGHREYGDDKPETDVSGPHGPAKPVLRSVPYQVFVEVGGQLPDGLRRRAAHYFGEVARVRAGLEAWHSGDLLQFGQLMRESGHSSIHNYRCGCAELVSLYELLCATEGVYGARFSGAGFRGCCVALIDPTHSEAIRGRVTRDYLAQYPDRRDGYGFFNCHSDEGAEII
ncbi:MAG: hypothetical protein MJE77_14935 [Proteobacteria bacterium]|nr:hypothetical protein [Pseudomonadota bacterium]